MQKWKHSHWKTIHVLFIVLFGLIILSTSLTTAVEKPPGPATRTQSPAGIDAFKQPQNYSFCHRCGMATAKNRNIITLYGVEGEPWHQCCPICALLDIIETGKGAGRIVAFSDKNGAQIEITIRNNKLTGIKPADAVLLVGGSCLKNKTFSHREEALRYIANHDWATPKMIQPVSRALQMVANKAEPIKRCSMCATTLAGHENTWFSIITKKKKRMVGCCAHCGIFMLHKLRGNHIRAVTRDWPSGEDIDARTAYYVVGSNKISCCVPSSISFAKQSTAEAFQNRYGGRIFTLEQALKNIEVIMNPN